MSKTRALLAFILMLFAIGGGLAIISVSRASSDEVFNAWFNNASNIETVIAGSTTSLPSATDYCVNTNVQVQRRYTLDFEEHCLTPTAMGLMSQIYYEWGVVQPQGYGKAYPVKYRTGGNPIIIPVPNQAAGIYFIGNSTGQGVYLGQFNQVSNRMKLKIDLSGVYYTITGDDLSPDIIFRYPDGQSLPFTGSLSFSSNGRYMVAEGHGLGFLRISLMNPTLKPFSASLQTSSGTGTTGAATAVSDDGRLAAIAYGSDSDGGPYLKLVDVDSCNEPMPTVPKKVTPICRETQLAASLKQMLPTVKGLGNVKFLNDRTIQFDASYMQGTAWRYARYTVTAGGYPKSLKQYLALGDSYISGEGAHSYRLGTDTARNQCHQSLASYPYLLSSNFSSFASVACSGAKLHNILKTDEDSYQVHGEEPTQSEINTALTTWFPGVTLQNDFVGKDNPEAVTVSIGGNDVGFGQILEKCIHPTRHLIENVGNAFTCYDTYEDRAEIVRTINGKFVRLRGLYESLKNDGASGRRVYVIGYPQVVKAGGECGLNVGMNAEEVKFAVELTSYLNGVIKRAANEAGVQYVDTEQAFDGHRLCEAPAGQSAVNGFTISRNPNDGYDFKTSFHPNQHGHQMLATAVAAQTNNLTKPMPAAAVKTNEVALDPGIGILQNVPKTNRTLRYVHAAENLVGKVIQRSLPINFNLDVNDYLTKANGIYDLVIHSTPRSLGTFTADSSGNLQISAVLPADLSPGLHTLHLYGNNMFGEPIDIQQVVFVAASAEDMDGDTVPNTNDSCVLAAQSGTDADGDAVDDVCDPLIKPAPNPDPNQEPEDIVWWNNAIMPITIQATSGP